MWIKVTDKETRRKYLGPWAAYPYVGLFTRYGTEFFASVLGRNPDTGEPCAKAIYTDGKHEYRHMTGPGINDVGGYVCLEDSPWSDETREATCAEFGPLTCRSCGDTYEPRPQTAG